MQCQTIQYFFAECDHKLVPIRAFTKEASGIPHCPGCKDLMIPVQGRNNEWHFRHRSGIGCEPPKFEHGCAVVRVCEALRGAMLGGKRPQIANDSEHDELLQHLLTLGGEIDTEFILPGGGRADIALLQEGIAVFVIEVYHSHFTERERRKDCPWVEVDATAILVNAYLWLALDPQTHQLPIAKVQSAPPSEVPVTPAIVERELAEVPSPAIAANTIVPEIPSQVVRVQTESRSESDGSTEPTGPKYGGLVLGGVILYLIAAANKPPRRCARNTPPAFRLLHRAWKFLHDFAHARG